IFHRHAVSSRIALAPSASASALSGVCARRQTPSGGIVLRSSASHKQATAGSALALLATSATSRSRPTGGRILLSAGAGYATGQCLGGEPTATGARCAGQGTAAHFAGGSASDGAGGAHGGALHARHTAHAG